MTTNVDTASVLRGLKDFQRATVEHAFHRLFDAPDSTHRFLVADEVGLGKTLVARGLVAKAIERLRAERVKRIDIVYVCSNAEIAAQNVRKLDVAGAGTAASRRLTLLANQVEDLRGSDLNIVALTPGTSFEQASATGTAEERVLLYWLLHEPWELGNSTGPKNLFQATTRRAVTFRRHLREFDRRRIDRGIAAEFVATLERRSREARARGERTIHDRFLELCDNFARSRRTIPEEQRRQRNALISELRGILAASCIEALEPDLVILDEFQRFKHLLNEANASEAASLARGLFDWQRAESGERARVLLLSATPYRALTVAGDGGGDDHHEDFLATVCFLATQPEPADELRGLLRDYQRELYGTVDAPSLRLRELRTEIQTLLSRYIARTERIGAAGRHDAMVRQAVRTPAPHAGDLRQYLLVQDIADELEQPDVTELWKSAPYLLNFLDGYQLRSRFDAACDLPSRARDLSELVDGRDGLLLDSGGLRRYGEIDPGTPRLRELAADVIDTEAWRMLWIPPSLPYHALGGAYARPELSGFTKRLVFSAWRAVPRAAAGLLSYLAERALTLDADPNALNTPQRRAAQRNRLAFSVDPNGRLTGMPALALLYPSPALGELADPRAFAAEYPGGSVAQMLDWGTRAVGSALARLPHGKRDTEPDARWYWAAPLLLDQTDGGELWDQPELAAEWTGHDQRASSERSRWLEHVELARRAARGALDPPLGRRPDDLAEVVARLALGAPGTLALRALARATDADPHGVDTRLAAARVGWGLRTLFNSPEATALLRASRTQAETFWREVLSYTIDGDLQAVLDEHAHVLRDSECSIDTPPSEAAAIVADAMSRALGLRASGVAYSDIRVSENGVTSSAERLYTAFAARFADEDGSAAAAGEAPARAAQLRESFNSPYWPFVLVTTAVGQEGLDFHPYCHVVVHWNLPANPVDLEQREGRVHRYKGHAVRKNVAVKRGVGALAAAGDPWRTAFERASLDRLPTDSELVPYWIYPLDEGAAVERQVLALPLSRELDRLGALRNALAVYRLAFGQARQQDVIDHLLTRLGPERAKMLAGELRIDLRPPPLAAGT